MLFGRKLYDYYQANKRLASIENRLNEIENENRGILDQHAEQIKLIAALNEKLINENLIIELALAEQKMILIQKDLERSEPGWMEESFSLLQMRQDLEQKVKDIKQYIPEAIWKEYYKVKEVFDNPVVEVKRQMCTGCFIALSKSNLNKWRTSKEIVKCDFCGRILA